MQKKRDESLCHTGGLHVIRAAKPFVVEIEVGHAADFNLLGTEGANEAD